MIKNEFDQIVKRVYPQMLKVGMDFFNSKSDAEDAAQEAVIKLWQWCENIDPNRNIDALAVKIAKNQCVDIMRKRQQTFVPEAGATSTPSPHEELEAAEMQQLMNEALARLKPRERSLFELRQEGLTNHEIASHTGIKRNSVKVIVSTARRKLFEEITKRLKE